MGTTSTIISGGENIKGANLYRHLIAEKVVGLASQHESGKYSPYIISSDSIVFTLLLTTVVALHYFGHQQRRYIRFSAFALILFNSLWVITHVRILSAAYGYGIGLIFSVGIMISAALLIFNDPVADFRRLEYHQAPFEDGPKYSPKVQSSSSISSSLGGNVTKRPRTTGDACGGRIGLDAGTPPVEVPQEMSLYHWQSYPTGFLHRLDWSFDLATSFRGAGWNWRVRPLGTLSKEKSSAFPTPTSRGIKQKFYVDHLLHWIVYYVALDALKLTFMYDTYFLGVAPISSPLPDGVVRHLPFLANPTCTRVYRLLLSTIGILTALNFIFKLGPLFYGVVLPWALPRNHYTPLEEPFLWPPFQQSFFTVLDQGLAGWWGKFWHQMFRFGASEPGRFAVQQLNWDPKSVRSRVLQVLIAFMVTGSIHFAGSYTMYNDTQAYKPFLFFFLQGVGILVQTFVTKSLGTNRLPKWLRRTGNLITVIIWGYYTGPLFANDLARSGLWLYEPIPISPLRGLGFGPPGESWWCWHGKWFIWWDGKPGNPWWRKGLAVT